MESNSHTDTIASPSSYEGGGNVFQFCYFSQQTKYIAVANNGTVTFQGETKESTFGDFMTGVISNKFIKMAVTAIKNRTRERNFARLSEQLALGEITEAEYEEELENNEDRYVIQCNQKPSSYELKSALLIANELDDVKDTDDLSVLFSFDETEIQNYLLK